MHEHNTVVTGVWDRTPANPISALLKKKISSSPDVEEPLDELLHVRVI